jgi:hypothetical protein
MVNKKKIAVISCPSCHGDMSIHELECSSCNIQVRGNFGQGSRYDQLNPDQAKFLETFLRCRGVLRDVEAALGISYPTVRSRLDALIAALGFTDLPANNPGKSAPVQTNAMERKEILAALDAGTMDAGAALEALNKLK